jgi:CheY-like chemotaxis protein
VTTILVAADAKWVRDQVRAAFLGPKQSVVEVTRGQDVRDTFGEVNPDLVILDMQIGNMGGIAVALDLRLEESAGRLDRANILLLLDRAADEFIARRADVDLILVKPVDAGVLRRAANQLLPAAS